MKANGISRTEQFVFLVITCLILVGSGFRLWYDQDRLTLEVEPVLWAGEASPEQQGLPIDPAVDRESENTGQEVQLATGEAHSDTGEITDLEIRGTGPQVNINTASNEELMALPGIGPVLASRIVEYRKQQGPFIDVEQLVEVKGIGTRILARLRPLVTVIDDQVSEGQE